jgi:hypothetical protein
MSTDLQTLHIRMYIEKSSVVYPVRLVWHPRGDYLAYAGFQYRLLVLDGETGEAVYSDTQRGLTWASNPIFDATGDRLFASPTGLGVDVLETGSWRTLLHLPQSSDLLTMTLWYWPDADMVLGGAQAGQMVIGAYGTQSASQQHAGAAKRADAENAVRPRVNQWAEHYSDLDEVMAICETHAGWSEEERAAGRRLVRGLIDDRTIEARGEAIEVVGEISKQAVRSEDQISLLQAREDLGDETRDLAIFFVDLAGNSPWRLAIDGIGMAATGPSLSEQTVGFLLASGQALVEMAIERGGEDVDAFRLPLAMAMYRAGDDAGAVAELDRAEPFLHEESSWHVFAKITRALVAYRLGNEDHARAILAEVTYDEKADPIWEPLETPTIKPYYDEAMALINPSAVEPVEVTLPEPDTQE